MVTKVKDAPVSNGIDVDARSRNLKILGAPAWIPTPGTTMTARFIALRKGGIGSEYGVYPILTVEDAESGEFVSVHAFHTLLKNKLVGDGTPANPGLRPKIGDVMTLHYEGTRPSKRLDKKGDPIDYHLYYVLEGDGTTALDINEWDYDND
jgi:hypothetical protein